MVLHCNNWSWSHVILYSMEEMALYCNNWSWSHVILYSMEEMALYCNNWSWSHVILYFIEGMTLHCNNCSWSHVILSLAEPLGTWPVFPNWCGRVAAYILGEKAKCAQNYSNLSNQFAASNHQIWRLWLLTMYYFYVFIYLLWTLYLHIMVCELILNYYKSMLLEIFINCKNMLNW